MIPSKKNIIQERYKRQYKSFFWSLRSKTTIQSKKDFHYRQYIVGWSH
jgi:hypothetical protein